MVNRPPYLEERAISVLGDLLLQQEDAKELLRETKGTSDRTIIQGLIESNEYSDDIVSDVAVIFRSLGGGGEIRMTDIMSAINFLDYAATLGLELRRKE